MNERRTSCSERDRVAGGLRQWTAELREARTAATTAEVANFQASQIQTLEEAAKWVECTTDQPTGGADA